MFLPQNDLLFLFVLLFGGPLCFPAVKLDGEHGSGHVGNGPGVSAFKSALCALAPRVENSWEHVSLVNSSLISSVPGFGPEPFLMFW